MESVGVPIYWNTYNTMRFVINSNQVPCKPDTAKTLFEKLIMDASTNRIIITRSDTSVELNVACLIELAEDDYPASVCGRKYFMEPFEKGQCEMKFNFNPEINLYVRKDWIIRGTVIFFRSVNRSHIITDVAAFKQLSDDYSTLLSTQDPSFADVELKCGSMIIPAHKNILSARTPVFAAMFRSGMKENRDGIILIDHLQPSTFKSMLFYIYSGKVQQLNVSTAGELLVAADMYQLPELRMICCNFLNTALSIDNVLDILVVGNLHDPKLKGIAVDFICKTIQFSSLKKMAQWKTLQRENPSLAVEILSSVLEYVQESKPTTCILSGPTLRTISPTTILRPQRRGYKYIK